MPKTTELRSADLRYADLRFDDLRYADLRYADLSGADLRFADLRYADLSDAILRDAVLRGVDLRYADLRGADLRGADLRGAKLSGAKLSGADWIPKIENIHQAVYAAASAEDAPHCRAGLVVSLAGAGGRVLEGIFGTLAAAALIYQNSDPNLSRIPNFYTDNREAMEDMRRLAEAEVTA